VPIVLKSGSLILLEPSGPVQAFNGIASPLPFLYIVAGVGIAFNNIKMFSIAMAVQQYVPITLLSIYRIFPTAVNNDNFSIL
jgi:hypothetical protein